MKRAQTTILFSICLLEMRFLIRFFRVYTIRSLNVYENICKIFFWICSRHRDAGRLLQCLFFPTPSRRKVLYSTVFFFTALRVERFFRNHEMQRSLIETGRALNFCSAGLLFFRQCFPSKTRLLFHRYGM